MKALAGQLVVGEPGASSSTCATRVPSAATRVQRARQAAAGAAPVSQSTRSSGASPWLKCGAIVTLARPSAGVRLYWAARAARAGGRQRGGNRGAAQRRLARRIVEADIDGVAAGRGAVGQPQAIEVGNHLAWPPHKRWIGSVGELRVGGRPFGAGRVA